MKVYLGIDTSCYTTSLCLLDEQAAVLADERRILTVPEGKRGLSQSEMVYQHVRNLPELTEKIASYVAGNTVCAVAVTDKPRRRDDSYMPAFLSGLGCARSLAAMLNVPLYRLSHQENHLLAAWRAVGKEPKEPYCALHLSGGTTDILRVETDGDSTVITRIGGTTDISAGQFIDRVGVALGLPFPAGKYVDRQSQAVLGEANGFPVWHRDGSISFSGRESHIQRLITAGETSCEIICAQTMHTVLNGILELLDTALAGNEYKTVVAVGGVMENNFLRTSVEAAMRRRRIEFIPAPQEFSADNASGAAFKALREYHKAGI